MSVEFEQEKQFERAFDQSTSSTSGGLTKWVIKTGFAKDEKGAKNIMIIVSIICFALAIYFIIK